MAGGCSAEQCGVIGRCYAHDAIGSPKRSVTVVVHVRQVHALWQTATVYRIIRKIITSGVK
jgi:hypothetical protein